MHPIGNRKVSLSEMLAKHLIWQSPDTLTAKLYHGHVIDVLNKMPSRSVQTIVTSPPYWALRDYGTGEWEGGDPKCDHVEMKCNHKSTTLHLLGHGNSLEANERRAKGRDLLYKDICGKCGAKRTDRQIGSEDTPEEYITTMVNVFRAVRRILRDDGTLWLNLGDTYGADGNGNLVGIPWRVALALQADGWILRQDNIWNKTNPMPESVQNRCTKSHEYVFLLTKSEKYFYDEEAIRENAEYGRRSAFRSTSYENNLSRQNGSVKRDPVTVSGSNPEAGRNKRSVWSIDDHKSLLEWLSVNDPELLARYLDEQTNKSDVWRISSQPYKGSHFATFPPKLVEPCIKAGTSEHGYCSACGSPYERILSEPLGGHKGKSWHPHDDDRSHGNLKPSGQKVWDSYIPSKTLGWKATCSCWVCQTCLKPWSHVCNCDGGEERFGKPPIRPCIVLDPFAGTFTTGEVAVSLGRYTWGIELSEKYIRDLAIPRILSAVMQRMADLQWQKRNNQTQ